MTTPPLVSSSSACHFPLTISVSLPAIAHNLATLYRLLSPGCQILAVVKADAYGHGALAVAHALARLGVSYFGVATVQEGVRLRQQGIRKPIIVMGGLLPDAISDLVSYRLLPVIANQDIAFHLSSYLLKQEQGPYPVHVKIDTGMGRLGFSPDEALQWLTRHAASSTLAIQGLMTHFADADSPDPTYTQYQFQRFQGFLTQLHKAGIRIPIIHSANSAAMIQYPWTHLDLVRPGIALYGYNPVSHRSSVSLKPAMTVSTSIVHLRIIPPGEPLGYNGGFRTTRSTRIAVLPVGYSHGLSRRLSNRGQVLIQSRRVPIVGKICMDMMMVDVSALPEVRVGEPVVILGQQGNEAITAHELAEWQDTIPYEVVCALGRTGARIYDPLLDESMDCGTAEEHAPFLTTNPTLPHYSSRSRL